MRKIRIAAIALVTAIFLTSCKAAEPVQAPVLMDDTWYVMTESSILMLCEVDESQKEYIEAIKSLKGDNHSVELAIEKLKSMEQTVEVKNALGIGAICLGKYEEAESYLDSALELAEDDLQKICILSNQIHVIKIVDDGLLYISAKDKYALLMEKKISDPIRNLVLHTNWALLDEKINTDKNPVDKIITVLEKLLKEEKDLLGSNQMIGVVNYKNLGDIYIISEVDIQKGIDYLNKAKKLNEETCQNPALEIALLSSQSDAYELRKDYDLALGSIAEWKEKGETFYNQGHPDLFKIYLSEGLAFYRSGRYDESIACFETLIKETKSNSYDSGTVSFNLGLAYYKKNEMKKALEYFTKSYCIFSTYEEDVEQGNIGSARDAMQRIYEEGGYSEATPDFDKWVEEQIVLYGEETISTK